MGSTLCRYDRVWKQSWSIIHGCKEVSSGCLNCVARTSMRQKLQYHHLLTPKWSWTGQADIDTDMVEMPLRLRRRNVLSCMSGDFFNPLIPDDVMDRCFDIMEITDHLYLLLTKRPESALDVVTRQKGRRSAKSWAEILKRLWVGVTVEKQRYDSRLEVLRHIPVDHKWCSLSPMLGPIRLGSYTGDLDWVYAGGESGQRARPMHPQWPIEIAEECRSARIPFYLVSRGRWVNVEDCGNPHRYGNVPSIDVVHRGETVTLFKTGRRTHNSTRALYGTVYDGVPSAVRSVLNKYRQPGRGEDMSVKKEIIDLSVDILGVVEELDGLLSGPMLHRIISGEPSRAEQQIMEQQGFEFTTPWDVTYDKVNYAVNILIDENYVERRGRGKNKRLHFLKAMTDAPREDPELHEVEDEWLRLSHVVENAGRLTPAARDTILDRVIDLLEKAS